MRMLMVLEKQVVEKNRDVDDVDEVRNQIVSRAQKAFEESCERRFERQMLLLDEKVVVGCCAEHRRLFQRLRAGELRSGGGIDGTDTGELGQEVGALFQEQGTTRGVVQEHQGVLAEQQQTTQGVLRDGAPIEAWTHRKLKASSEKQNTGSDGSFDVQAPLPTDPSTCRSAPSSKDPSEEGQQHGGGALPHSPAHSESPSRLARSPALSSSRPLPPSPTLTPPLTTPRSSPTASASLSENLVRKPCPENKPPKNWAVLIAGEHGGSMFPDSKKTRPGKYLGGHCSLQNIGKAYSELLPWFGRENIIVIAQLGETLDWLESVCASVQDCLRLTGKGNAEFFGTMCRRLE